MVVVYLRAVVLVLAFILETPIFSMNKYKQRTVHLPPKLRFKFKRRQILIATLNEKYTQLARLMQKVSRNPRGDWKACVERYKELSESNGKN